MEDSRRKTSDAFCTTRQSANAVLPSTWTVRSSTLGVESIGASVGCGRAGALPASMEPALAMDAAVDDDGRAHAFGSRSLGAARSLGARVKNHRTNVVAKGCVRPKISLPRNPVKLRSTR